MIFRIIIFMLLNFVALGLGGLFTGSAVTGEWYLGLVKAPWTPPGWVFGVAWTTIMICYAFYMAALWRAVDNKMQLAMLYFLQWCLNVLWNPVFFYFHLVAAGLAVIIALTILVGFFLYHYKSPLKFKSVLIWPYFIWLLVATSLNAYILFAN